MSHGPDFRDSAKEIEKFRDFAKIIAFLRNFAIVCSGFRKKKILQKFLPFLT
jgi:hypothetical protein